MRRVISLLGLQRTLVVAGLAVSISFLTAGLVSPVTAKSNLAAHAPGQIIVRFRPGVSERAQSEFISRHKAQMIDSLDFVDAKVIKVPEGRTMDSWLNVMKGSQIIRSADLNYKLRLTARPDATIKAAEPPNDGYFGKLWGLHNKGQAGGVKGTDINMLKAWGAYKPKRSIVVAVIDSGVDYTHTDLVHQMWINRGEDRDHDNQVTRRDFNGIDDDNNGYVDDIRGWDFANNDKDPMDDNDHGTHVAGVIAARSNNGYGVSGIVGNGRVKIMPLKFLDKDGNGYTTDAIKALEYATRKGAIISNNSWGGGPYNTALYEAINNYRARGGLFVAAAGNDGWNNDMLPSYPASYKANNVIAVAALGPDNLVDYYSNYGRNSVHIAAPGSNILSTIPKNRFSAMWGTSMAAPHVAGVAAMVWTQYPHLKVHELRALIINSARRSKTHRPYTASSGVLDAYNALEKADGTDEDNAANKKAKR